MLYALLRRRFTHAARSAVAIPMCGNAADVNPTLVMLRAGKYVLVEKPLATSVNVFQIAKLGRRSIRSKPLKQRFRAGDRDASG
jgi:hypothetical protein